MIIGKGKGKWDGDGWEGWGRKEKKKRGVRVVIFYSKFVHALLTTRVCFKFITFYPIGVVSGGGEWVGGERGGTEGRGV